MAESYESIKKLQPSKLTESIKSMEWGMDQRSHYYQQVQSRSHVEKRQQIDDGDERYKSNIHRAVNHETYTSQITANPFKKDKNGQIQKLYQLKKQYEILKNIHIEDQLRRSNKTSVQMSRNSQSSSSASLKSGPSKSVYSRSRTHKSYKNEQPRNEIYDFQRKQLQLMLSNSMAKVEDLLRMEVEYKKKIHELAQNASISKEDQSKITIAQFQDKQKSLHEIISNLKHQQDRLRNLNRELAHKVGQLQGEMVYKQGQIRKLNEEKRKYEESYLLQRQKFMTNQIEVKRLQMEKQILEKQKDSEIHRLENIMATNGESSHHNTELYKLTEQIKLKDQRYNLLLKQLETYRSSKPQIPADFLHKIANIEEAHDSTLKKQIDLIKKEFSKMREGSQTQDIHSLHLKIQQFEKIVDEENYHKVKLMDQITELNEDYDKLKRENRKLKDQLDNSEFQYRRVKKQLASLRNDLDVSENARVTLSVSHMDQNAMVNRLKNPERLEQSYEELKTQYSELKKLSKLKDNQSDTKIRELLRRIDELEFEVERLRKQNAFNLQLAAAKSKADLELMQNQENRAYKERDEWKRQFQTMKVFYEQKMAQLRMEANRIGEQYSQKCQGQQTTIRQLRKGIDQDLQNLRLKNQSEQATLLSRLESLTQSNERLAQQNTSLIHIQGQLHELRQHYRKMKTMNDNVDHLWLVKEQEYANVNDLLKEFVQ